MLDHSKDYDFGQFKGRLDVEAAAVMGHSFGGGTTVLALHDEPRFRYHNNIIVIQILLPPIPIFFFFGVTVYQPRPLLTSCLYYVLDRLGVGKWPGNEAGLCLYTLISPSLSKN